MKSLAEMILSRAAGLPEGTPVGTKMFLDLERDLPSTKLSFGFFVSNR